jgi:hypothetical protein
MASKNANDVKVTDKGSLGDGLAGHTHVEAEQNGVTGEGRSSKSGHEGKVEATQKAAEEIAAKKSANA